MSTAWPRCCAPQNEPRQHHRTRPHTSRCTSGTPPAREPPRPPRTAAMTGESSARWYSTSPAAMTAHDQVLDVGDHAGCTAATRRTSSGTIAKTAARGPRSRADQLPQQQKRATRQQHPQDPGTRDRRADDPKPAGQEYGYQGGWYRNGWCRSPTGDCAPLDHAPWRRCWPPAGRRSRRTASRTWPSCQNRRAAPAARITANAAA